MPHISKPIKPALPKKTLDQLLGEGQVKLGKTVLDEKEQQAKAQAIFAEAAQEEERSRRYKRTR